MDGRQATAGRPTARALRPALTVRSATVDDAPAVADLVHRAYRADESRRGWTTEADLIGGQRTDTAMVRELVTAPGSVVLVGQEQDRLLVCCHLERRERSAYLGMFAVHPDGQGRGTGRAMLAAAEAHARRWAAEQIELTVLAQRPELIAWYERCGFALTGQEQQFPYGDPRFGLPRRDDLVLLGMSRRVGEA